MSVVETALRSTYHLAGSDASRLRRLTRQSGLEAENVLSRLAIMRSIAAGAGGPHGEYQPSQSGRPKEIKGTVLLGRPRQAALILAMLARHQDGEFVDTRAALTWHWARGLRLLDDDSTDGDVLHVLANQLASNSVVAATPDRRARRSGLGGSLRDELAAAVGRRFPRWSTEVRRLVVMAARLDPNQLDAIAERLATDAERTEPGSLLSEKLALRILQEKWGLNRLGLTASDRETLGRLLADDAVATDELAIPFLEALGLVKTTRTSVRLSPMGRRLGEEAVHP